MFSKRIIYVIIIVYIHTNKRRGKNEKKLPNNKRSVFSIFPLLVVLIILFITIGYSAFQNTGIISDITATVRPQFNIIVSGVEVESTSDAIVINKDYNSTGSNNVYTGKIFSDVTFTKTTSSVTYKV